jgi:hypothetical protein
MVSASRTNFPLETMENLDTIYEAWLFFEFVDFFSQQHRLLELQIDESPNYFDFEYDGHKLRFYYEQYFTKGKGYAWALDSNPDFSVMEVDRIIAVFDAKNYGKNSAEKRDATNKMLAYLTNLDAGFGGLFFPNFETAMFKYPNENEKPKHHFNLQLMHYKMEPSDTLDALKAKHETLDSVNKEIGRRLEIIVQ